MHFRLLCACFLASWLYSGPDFAWGQLAEFLSEQPVAWQIRLADDAGNPIELGEDVLFTLPNGEDLTLHRTNGAAVFEIGTLGGANSHVVAGDHAFFYAPSLDESVIFATDGRSLTEMNVGPLSRWVIGPADGSVLSSPQMRAVGDRVVFRAKGPNGWDLHYSGGTTIGSFDVNADVIPEVLSGTDEYIVFQGEEGLYRTDGSSVTPMMVGDRRVESGRGFFEFRDELYFEARIESSRRELVRIEGMNLDLISPIGFFLRDHLVDDDVLYFLAETADSGSTKRLYRSDGRQHTALGFESPNGHFTRLLATHLGEIYFRTSDTVYRSDGDELASIGPMKQFRGPYPNDIGFSQGFMLIPGSQGINTASSGFGILKTDGFESEWIDLGGIREPQLVGSVGGSALFFAWGDDDEPNLLKFTGETMEWLDFEGTPSPIRRAKIGNQLFFNAYDHPDGPLFVTDGESIIPLGDATIHEFDESYYVKHHSEDGVELTKILKRPSECDFNNDGVCDLDDIDGLMANPDNPAKYDITGDNVVDDDDRDIWLSFAGSARGFADGFLVGDANLDGIVSQADLNVVGRNWLSADALTWSSGNFSHAGASGVGPLDLDALARNWQRSSQLAVALPEPSGTLVMTALLCLVVIARLRSSGTRSLRVDRHYRRKQTARIGGACAVNRLQ